MKKPSAQDFAVIHQHVGPRNADSFRQDLHPDLKADFVPVRKNLANPPFNVDAVDTATRVSARRHPEGTSQDLPARQVHKRLKDPIGPHPRSSFGFAKLRRPNGEIHEVWPKPLTW